VGRIARHSAAGSCRELNDPFAWFNLGTSYVAVQDWPNAAAAYDHARQLGLPWRMTWYQFGWFDAYLRTGRYDDVLALADATIKVTPNIEEMFYYKGSGTEGAGKFRCSAHRFELALKSIPISNRPAQHCNNSARAPSAGGYAWRSSAAVSRNAVEGCGRARSCSPNPLDAFSSQRSSSARAFSSARSRGFLTI
jgi:tetratricopeptide (TPR) repeat protein